MDCVIEMCFAKTHTKIETVRKHKSTIINSPSGNPPLRRQRQSGGNRCENNDRAVATAATQSGSDRCDKQ
jgi:hypothetical protein